MSRYAWAGLAALAAFPATAYDGMREPRDCALQVEDALAAAGIRAGDVAGISYLIERTGGNDGVDSGVSAWARLRSCAKGYIVVVMDLDCRPWQVFSFGECRVPGIPPG